ncbi:hypothetical protein [uncultured Croceitalea sp.]|uniref:hypothetical protein n=1 Tax=uncultured Croceitalea sp. TaxID=1798908 RepID=UPI0033061D90
MKHKTKFNQLAKKRILIESLVAFLIMLSPFVFKTHEYMPAAGEGDSFSILGFTIGLNGYPSVESHVWFLVSKFVPFYLLVIWFLTCRHWWHHIILIPILMYSFQLFELYFSEDEIIDSENLMWLLPVCIVIIPFVYFIRLKLYDKHVHGIDLDAMDTELTILKEKEELRKEREKLEQRKETLEKKM